MAQIAEPFVAFGCWFARRPKSEIVVYCLLLTSAIGCVDYFTGVWVSLSVIYTVPIGIAAWYVGRRTAFAIALLSTVVWVIGDWLSGVPGEHQLVQLWNGSIRLLFYIVLVVVLCRLRDLQRDLGRHVRERTAALTAEIAERQRLERQMMNIADNERRRIGQQLHDSLSQHLTGTALVCQGLSQKLAAGGMAEAADARKVVDLVEQGIALARGIAKGLLPVEIQAGGLMQALDELAAATSQAQKVSCVFDCESPVLVRSPGVATHLFHIAQEAVSNAVRHGCATRIVIAMNVAEHGLILSVADNGRGMPSRPNPSGGVGLNIMADRVKVLNGSLSVRNRAEGGTEVLCVIPFELQPDHD